ncbi:large-conductance mechanosensitive channel protein MscL [Loigolactobacillus backii]|uniref:Large-conductance mechanosensitive channel n=1 Tax=Loigolactobacillus backii TaxID=375175 RepID=A0A192H2X7_9LACO|nr:large-conductance mechanosensitive channel protein MscL [Loigolactobacillus backii]ANK60253.1 mechanosensitive ion channel protein MscL [Loigolactobacillus backii]ANK62306.1 mechanosensitive ion channel protein MscL [Loigolactobacillus backii]ANK65135.1 mechanosensitive ion channel protein MscL [Loigolactobacillus backii]ANK67694.1 mechanosensitive ion channel protein MscL [Loigolactobacillus backii]ANK70681.1 mechanosensitive ion channel protein MscL [Loigolactobacillus backii]
MLKEFRDFIMRGNIMDLAVGVIIGGAFTTIVKSLTTNLINPILALVVGKVDLSSWVVNVGQTEFKVGSFLNDVINFIIIAFIVFLLIKALKRVQTMSGHEKQEETIEPTQEELYLKEIRDLLASKTTTSGTPGVTPDKTE